MTKRVFGWMIGTAAVVACAVLAVPAIAQQCSEHLAWPPGAPQLESAAYRRRQAGPAGGLERPSQGNTVTQRRGWRRSVRRRRARARSDVHVRQRAGESGLRADSLPAVGGREAGRESTKHLHPDEMVATRHRRPLPADRRAARELLSGISRGAGTRLRESSSISIPTRIALSRPTDARHSERASGCGWATRVAAGRETRW